MSWADSAPQAARARQRRPARSGGRLGRLRRRGHRPLPHRAHVLRRGEDRPDARDDRRRERGRSPRGPGQAAAAAARGLRTASSGRWPDGRSPSGRWIRRCTSSSPTTRRACASWRRRRASRSSRSKARIDELKESNPMLGHRGCRLGITYPEITEMQARAIFEAACDLAAEGEQVFPEIMIPLVGTKKELDLQADLVRKTADAVFAERGSKVELPGRHDDRGSPRRGDGERDRRDRRVLLVRHQRPDPDDVRPVARRRAPCARRVPEATRSTRSIRSSASIARAWAPDEDGRRAGPGVKPKLKLGICGEHGGDPSSVEFCHEIGLDYVSCSPYRLPDRPAGGGPGRAQDNLSRFLLVREVV